MTKRTINCAEAVRLLAAFLDREVTSSDDEHVQAHLRTCRSCYSRAEFERRLKASLLQVRSESPTPDFEQRIRQLLQKL